MLTKKGVLIIFCEFVSIVYRLSIIIFAQASVPNRIHCGSSMANAAPKAAERVIDE